MKRLILVIMVLVFSGCSVVRIDTNNINNTIEVVLSKNNTLFNQIGQGYKYYVPRGISYLESNEYNDILYSNGNNYYLYIDVVSYYHKKEVIYEINEEAYISRNININEKNGYLEINQQSSGLYYIEFMYNYAKIETLVSEEYIEDAILYSSYILSTIKFNDNVIELSLNDEFLITEEKYDIFTSKKNSDGFLKLEEEVIE